jgi:outer membrane protein OmpA-like peptidoglycan-associated protein
VYGGKVPLYTEIYAKEKELSHGVFLSIYVHEEKNMHNRNDTALAINHRDTKEEIQKKTQEEFDKSPDMSQNTLQNNTLILHFEVNSDKILHTSCKKIGTFAEFLKANPTYGVQIVGHTDSSGDKVLNLDLSHRRAMMTKSALVEEGVEPSRLATQGIGDLHPVVSNLTLEGRETNRRIETELFLQQ